MNALMTRMAFTVQDVALRPFVYTSLRSLAASKDLGAQIVADAVRDAFRGGLSEEEHRRIEAIESLREELNASRDIADIMDYGAGGDAVNGTSVRRTLGEVALSSSKPYRWALLLFFLVERLQPERCLEFGTCLGISTLYQAAGLALNGRGSIVTMEGSRTLAEAAQRNFSRLGYTNIDSRIGRFDDVLPAVLREEGPFDLVFIDGHHEGEATVRYFEAVLPSLKERALVIFDDIHWSAGMKRAWKTIASHPRTAWSVDLYQLGIIMTT